MYLENYYIFKNHFFLIDKTLNQRKYNFYLKIKSLNFKIKIRIKNAEFIFNFLFLILIFLNFVIFKFKNHWMICMLHNSDIFIFLNNFILIWLPLSIQNMYLVSLSILRLSTLTYYFDYFPLIVEIEKLMELNNYNFKILKNIEYKLVLNTRFININHKESFSRMFKLPLMIN